MPQSYSVSNLCFDWKANKRFESLSSFEQKRGYRVVGGNHGDVRFDGFAVSETGTELCDVRFVTSLEHLSESEAGRLAREVVEEAFASIGAECVEHS